MTVMPTNPALATLPREQPSATADPLISVVIATRDRSDSVLQTIESVLANRSSYAHFEIFVVDQSLDDRSQQYVQDYAHHPQVDYRRSPTVGMAKARNLAITQAAGELIAITDDDCIVSKTWLREIYNAFAAYPQISILFGNVLPDSHDEASGFIPSYQRQEMTLISRAWHKNDVDGLGACMAIRKSVWQSLHGFDERLGVGGDMRSSSEGDLVLQALYQGYQVCETPMVEVVHHGFRSWEAGAHLIARYWYGTGAMFGKHLKLRPINTVGLLVRLAWRWAFGASRVADSLGSSARKLARLRAFAAGFWRGLTTPVVRQTGHFKRPS